MAMKVRPRRSPVGRTPMSIIDRALEANLNYAKSYDPALGKRPPPKIAAVTCMDPRLSDLPGILGLPQADIDVIRTGGPAVTVNVVNPQPVWLRSSISVVPSIRLETTSSPRTSFAVV
jgi:carbonic anhydrase